MILENVEGVMVEDLTVISKNPQIKAAVEIRPERHPARPACALGGLTAARPSWNCGNFEREWLRLPTPHLELY